MGLSDQKTVLSDKLAELSTRAKEAEGARQRRGAVQGRPSSGRRDRASGCSGPS